MQSRSGVVLSRFVFQIPHTSATSDHEFNVIITHRRAFNMIETASLRPEWKSDDDLKSVSEAKMEVIYVLYEFVGEVFEHLSQLNCRTIGPAVIIQSYENELIFPMRTYPTWSQSMHGQMITAYGFTEECENEIKMKTIRLGGCYKKQFDPARTTILITGIHNRHDPVLQDTIQHQVKILRKDWIDLVYESDRKLNEDTYLFFTAEYLEKECFKPDTTTQTVQTSLSASQHLSGMHSILEDISYRDVSYEGFNQQIASCQSMITSNVGAPFQVYEEITNSTQGPSETGSQSFACNSQWKLSQGSIMHMDNSNGRMNRQITWDHSRRSISQTFIDRQPEHLGSIRKETDTSEQNLCNESEMNLLRNLPKKL